MSKSGIIKAVIARVLLAVGVFAVAAGAAYGVARFVQYSPVELAPAGVDFGDVKQNQMLDATFTVFNNGGEDLALERFHVSCGCMSLARLEGSSRTPVGEEPIIVVPGGQASFRTGMAASSTRGPTSGTVEIETNSPEVPRLEFLMEAVIVGQLTALPPRVNVGRLVEGETKRVSVVVMNGNAGKDFVLDRVTSDSKSVEIASVNAESSDSKVCTIHATIRGLKPGPLTGKVSVFGKSQPEALLVIPVYAQFIPRWSARPSALVFPKRTAAVVADQYSADVQLFSESVPAEFKVESLPEWLSADYTDATEENGFRVRLVVTNQNRGQSNKCTLSLVKVGADDSGSRAELPVFLTAPKAAGAK